MQTTGINRLIMHHTGGGLIPSAYDLTRYHGATDVHGKHHEGKFPISANRAGAPLRSGKYAAHCKNLNSGSAGETLAGMARSTWAKPYDHNTFFSQQQVEAFILRCALVVAQYRLSIGRRTTLSHAEVEITLGVDQEAKWDFDYNPFGPTARPQGTRDPVILGDMMRERMDHAMKRARSMLENAPSDPYAPVIEFPLEPLAQYIEHPHVCILQRRLNEWRTAFQRPKPLGKDALVVDGRFGPATARAVRFYQGKSNLLPDGRVAEMTWLSLFGSLANIQAVLAGPY
jgi:hypothetical protein